MCPDTTVGERALLKDLLDTCQLCDVGAAESPVDQMKD